MTNLTHRTIGTVTFVNVVTDEIRTVRVNIASDPDAAWSEVIDEAYAAVDRKRVPERDWDTVGDDLAQVSWKDRMGNILGPVAITDDLIVHLRREQRNPKEG